MDREMEPFPQPQNHNPTTKMTFSLERSEPRCNRRFLFLCPPEFTSKTAPRSVQPFCRIHQCVQQTQRQTDHAASVAIGCILVLRMQCKKSKGSPYSITERYRVPELIPVFGSQPAGDVNNKPDGRLPLLSVRPAVTPATLKTAATNFAAW